MVAPDGSRFCPGCGRRFLSSAPASVEATTLAVEATTLAVEATRLAVDETRLAASPTPRTAPPPGAPAAAHADLTAGIVLADRYRIVRMLGRGGMGEVYEADDEKLRQKVALKFLPPALAADPDRLQRFHDEVRIARQISHRNVGRVYDIVEADGYLFLSMELIDGEDLGAAIARAGRLEGEAAIDLARQICAGLAAIHEKGVLHRDLKPANIMIDRSGRPHLMDFGLASVGAGADIRAGTPAYMAPEQLLGEAVTARSDLYALGLVLYEIFTGQRALRAHTVDDLVTHHRSGGAIAAPSTLQTSLDASMDRAIAACLARDPARRPADATAVIAMMQTVLVDGTNRSRRLLQQALPALGAMITTGALLSLLAAPAGQRWPLVALTIVGLAFAAVSPFITLDWRVTYKGHDIHFQNHPFLCERLFIDGVKVAGGGLGVHKTLRGTIESGQGAGERITADSSARPTEFKVRIVAEAFK